MNKDFFNTLCIQCVNYMLIDRAWGLHSEILDREPRFCSTDQQGLAQPARSVLENRGPIFHCTDRTSKVNKLFIIWLKTRIFSSHHSRPVEQTGIAYLADNVLFIQRISLISVDLRTTGPRWTDEWYLA